jgi:hypothetical protein
MEIVVISRLAIVGLLSMRLPCMSDLLLDSEDGAVISLKRLGTSSRVERAQALC